MKVPITDGVLILGSMDIPDHFCDRLAAQMASGLTFDLRACIEIVGGKHELRSVSLVGCPTLTPDYKPADAESVTQSSEGVLVSYSQTITVDSHTITRSASLTIPQNLIGKNLPADVDDMLEMLKNKTANGANANPE